MLNISGNSYAASPPVPPGGVALPGLTNMPEGGQQFRWTPRLVKQNRKWREKRSTCERPRTYDKFYQKTPGNFTDPQTDSAVSVCDSEEEEEEKMEKKRRITRRQSMHDKTLTERDIKHLERHLSMKRTIRKKIMRDLQQAGMEDDGKDDKLGGLKCYEQLGHSENILDLLRDSEDSGVASPIR